MINKKQRRSIEARMEILDAVGRTLKKQGYAKLNLNTVGEEVNLDKSALYRYFGNFEELLRAYIERQDYWLKGIKEFGDVEVDDKAGELKHIIKEQFKLLDKNPEFQQLLIWELADKDGLTTPISIRREMFSRKLIEQAKGVLELQGINLNYIIALIFSGFYFLILHKEQAEFCGVDMKQKEHKEEFLRTVDWMVDKLLICEDDKTKQTIIKAHQEGIAIETISKITDVPLDEVKRVIGE